MIFFQKTVHSENWLLPHFCLGSNQLLYTKSGHHCINAQLCLALHWASSMPALPHSIGSLQFRMADNYPQRFKHARMIAIHKPNKASYDSPGAWRPIALLNTCYGSDQVLQTAYRLLTDRLTSVARD